MLVLLHQPLPVGGHQPRHLHGQAHHGGGDLKQLGIPVEVAVAVVGHGEAEGPRRLLIQEDGHAEEGELRLLPLLLPEHAGAIQEQGLLAGLGQPHGLAAHQDAAVDALPRLVVGPLRRLPGQAPGRLDAQPLPFIIGQEDGPVQGPEGLRQDLQGPGQRRAEVRGSQGVAELQQG